MPTTDSTAPRRGLHGLLRSRTALLLAFAFAVMADPVSSVAYAIEAALRALNGDLALLVPTMTLVVVIIALVILNYRQLVIRYPQGGGAAAATGEAFGDRWSFIPIGALVVDFVLTIAISVSAGASAAIAYFPALAPWRLLIALGLIVLVGGITWFGHLGRLVFAAMTIAFIVVAAIVLIYGLGATPEPVGTVSSSAGHPPVLAVILAFPVAMALATGVEAPSSAIAQLGQLDNPGRSRFGRITLWLTLGIVGTITLGLATEAAHLNVGIPPKTAPRSQNLLGSPHRQPCSPRSSSSPHCCSWPQRAHLSRPVPACSGPWPGLPTRGEKPSESSLPGLAAPMPTTPLTGVSPCSFSSPGLPPQGRGATIRNLSCSMRSRYFSVSWPGWPRWPCSPAGRNGAAISS